MAKIMNIGSVFIRI